MALQAQIEETAGSGTWVEMASRFTNSTGTPLVSANDNDEGEAIADVYTLAFSSVIAGTSATVTVTASAPNNPYNGRVKTGVLLDGSTARDDIVPGVDLVFSNSGSFTGSWAAEVRVGHYHGVKENFPPNAGVAGTARRIRVLNTGSDDASNCFARLISRAIRYRMIGRVFARIRPFAEAADEKLDGNQIESYAITVSSVSGSGASKTMNFRVDGSAVNVQNLTTLATGTSDGLNVVDYYRVTAGALEGFTFLLSQDAVNSDEENVLIFGNRFMQIAEDSGGTPGTWGTTDVNLTESGEATGVITASGVAFFHMRVLVPENGNSESNPYIDNVALQATVSTAAGWTS